MWRQVCLSISLSLLKRNCLFSLQFLGTSRGAFFKLLGRLCGKGVNQLCLYLIFDENLVLSSKMRQWFYLRFSLHLRKVKRAHFFNFNLIEIVKLLSKLVCNVFRQSLMALERKLRRKALFISPGKFMTKLVQSLCVLWKVLVAKFLLFQVLNFFGVELAWGSIEVNHDLSGWK